LGTPLYMSPEQARGDQAAIDARSDLYSAFVVLFELLTLHRYVREESNVYATLQEVIEGGTAAHDVSVWLHPTQPAVPVELRYFVKMGLQRDPAQRFPSASEALLMLERIRSGEIHVACMVTFFKAAQHRVSSVADRNPRRFAMMATAAGLGMLGLLALAGLGVAALVYQAAVQPSHPRDPAAPRRTCIPSRARKGPSG